MTATTKKRRPQATFTKRAADALKIKPEPRSMVWDEETKAVFLEMTKETAAATAKQVFEAIGVDPQVHREQHIVFMELIPWIKAQKIKTENQAKFWESLVTENFRKAITFSFWLIVLAIVLGISGAWHLVIPLITHIAG